MDAIYRKTATGQQEVAAKALGLAPRVRSVLIMVDGQRSSAQLRAMLGPGADEALAHLVAQGLVVALPSTSASSPAAQTPIPAAQSAAIDVNAISRQAARTITDLLGPDGDRLALSIERANKPEALRTALESAANVLDSVAPKAAAEAFRRSYLG